MPTLPASPQASYLASAAQAQPLAACNSSEQSQAVEGQPQKPVRDPAATSQEPLASVRDMSPASSVAVAEAPVDMHHQPCDPVHQQLSNASTLEASSQSAHGLSDSVTDGEAACVTDRRISSAASGCMDSVTDGGMAVAVCTAASDVGGQHYSCSGAELTGALRAGQDFDLAGCECDIHGVRQQKLSSVEDRLGSNLIAASACAIDSSTCSATSSIACSIASCHTACSEGSRSSTRCSEGHASPVPLEPMLAVKTLADDANLGSSDPASAQPRITDAQTDVQPPTSNMLPASNSGASAAAMCQNVAPVTNAVDSSASDDAQASSASGSMTTSSAGSPCEIWQKADAGAEQADSLSIMPASKTDSAAGPAQACCCTSPSARVAHDDFTSSDQSQVVLKGAGVVPSPAEPPACSTLLLLAPGTGDRLTEASAQLGIPLAGSSVSIMTDMLQEAGCSRVAAAAATAVVYQAQTEVVETGVQTDASMSPCRLNTGTKSGCSGIDCLVELQADTQSVGSAHSISASDSSSESGPVARKAATSHRSLPARAAAESRSAMVPCLTEEDLASGAAHADLATHSKAVRNATGASGNQTCLSNVAAAQTDASCQDDAQAGLCSTAQYQSESEKFTSNSARTVVLDQASPFLLELVTACDGHNSLKELIRADMCCFPYESDSFLMSVCGQITNTLTHDNL